MVYLLHQISRTITFSTFLYHRLSSSTLTNPYLIHFFVPLPALKSRIGSSLGRRGDKMGEKEVIFWYAVSTLVRSSTRSVTDVSQLFPTRWGMSEMWVNFFKIAKFPNTVWQKIILIIFISWLNSRYFPTISNAPENVGNASSGVPGYLTLYFLHFVGSEKSPFRPLKPLNCRHRCFLLPHHLILLRWIDTD